MNMDEGTTVICQQTLSGMGKVFKNGFDVSSLTMPHALQSCWDAQLAGLDADALCVALEGNIFIYLDNFIQANNLAEELQLAPDSTGYFLELLWSTGVLERQYTADAVPVYRTCMAFRPYLHPASEKYCGDALLFRHRMLRQTGLQLASQLRECGAHSEGVGDAGQQRGWAQAAKIQIAQEQRAVTVDVAKEILKHLPEFLQMRRILDLGGGPGLVAIALANLQPKLTGVVFEYPSVAKVAQDNIRQEGLSGRLQARSGDLTQDDLGCDYDLIWCSSVLHFVPDIPAILTRLYEALRPGGMLICCHAEISKDLCKAKPILEYYLHMRVQGRHVMPEGWMTAHLLRAGFISVEQIEQVRAPIAPVTVLIARKGGIPL